MSTNDVPGANPVNNDQLGMGCWAEHQDGSLVFVESTEGGRVIYSMFDLSKTPPIEYRDAMPEVNFKRMFSWDPTGKKPGPNERWVWHDKTAFPWDRVIKKGVNDGPRVPSAEQQMSAAERVAESLRLRAEEFNEADNDHRMDRFMNRMEGMMRGIRDALERLPGGNRDHRRGRR